MPTDSTSQGTERERERIVQEGIAREVERVMGVPYHPTQFAGAAKNLLALLGAAPSGELRPICAHCDKPSTHLDPAQSFYPACDEHGAGAAPSGEPVAWMIVAVRPDGREVVRKAVFDADEATGWREDTGLLSVTVTPLCAAAAPAERGERAVVEEAYSRGWEDYRDWMPYRPTKACADLLAAAPAGRSWPERVDDAFRVIANAPVESEGVEDVIAGLRERIDALQSLVPVERAGLRDLLEYIAREYGRFMSDRDRQKVGAALAAAPREQEPDARCADGSYMTRDPLDGSTLLHTPQPPAPGETQESAGEMISRLGMDGVKWAAEFRATALRLGYSDMDEGWLIGWFCNAIMAGYDEAQRRAAPTGEAARQAHQAHLEGSEAAHLADALDRIRAGNTDLETEDMRDLVEAAHRLRTQAEEIERLRAYLSPKDDRS